MHIAQTTPIGELLGETPTPPRPAPQTTLDATINFNWDLYDAFGQVCKVLLDRAHYLESIRETRRRNEPI